MLSIVDASSPLSYLLVVILIIVAGFFAGSEVAYSNSNRYKIKVWADDGKKRAKATIKIIDHFDDMIIATLTATNIIHVSISVIATLIFTEILRNEDIGSIVATIVSTILVFTFSEIIPKNIAKANSDKWAINSAFILWFFIYILYPIDIFFSLLVKLIRKIINSHHEEDNFTDDDFQDVVDKISHEGVIDEEESEIIIAAVDFGETVVGEVLTKKENIVSLDINKCNNKYLKKFLMTTNYSRIPVYQGSIDNIIGILHVRSYLKELWKNPKVNVRDCLKKPYYVSPKVKLDEIFEGFKQNKTHIAIVKERRHTIGMVTMKDVLEELVSDIDEKGTSDDRNIKKANDNVHDETSQGGINA